MPLDVKRRVSAPRSSARKVVLCVTCQPAILRRAGSTTRLKVTMLLTGFPGSPKTSMRLLPLQLATCWKAYRAIASCFVVSLGVTGQVSITIKRPSLHDKAEMRRNNSLVCMRWAFSPPQKSS